LAGPGLRTVFALLIGVFFLFRGPDASRGDVYRYKDENGVWHFTNIKSDARYRLYIRSYPKGPNRFIKDYDRAIRQAAVRFAVDASLIKAVIKAESDFDHKAISSKGAQGLMQLMPQTSDQMRVQDPFDPEENITGGTRYLSLMLDRFRNDKRLAIAAYNAGPENVEAYNGIPPFPETQAFVKRVLQYYQQFKSTMK
jgi:soluble lytic murein transglycosylase